MKLGAFHFSFFGISTNFNARADHDARRHYQGIPSFPETAQKPTGRFSPSLVNSVLTIAHELAHYYSTVGTPAGYLLLRIRHRMMQMISACTKDLTEKIAPKAIFTPLPQWANMLHKCHPAKSILSFWLGAYSDLQEFGHLILGQTDTDVVRAVQQWRHVQRILVGMRVEGYDDKELLNISTRLPNEARACAAHQFSTENILEWIAYMHEVRTLTSHFGEKYFKEAFGARLYGRQVFDYVTNVLSDFSLEDQVDASLISSSLSLFAPVDPLYWRLWDGADEFLWEDLHPSWRLIRALVCIKKLGPISTLDCPSTTAAYMDEICDLLRWPRLSVVLGVGAGVSSNRESPAAQYFLGLHRQTCQLWREVPSLLVRLSGADEHVEKAHKLGPPFIVTSDAIRVLLPRSEFIPLLLCICTSFATSTALYEGMDLEHCKGLLRLPWAIEIRNQGLVTGSCPSDPDGVFEEKIMREQFGVGTKQVVRLIA